MVALNICRSTLNGPFVEAPPPSIVARDAADLVDCHGVSPVTGIDWGRIMRQIAFPEEAWLANSTYRFAIIGNVEDLLPSRKWYSLGHIGPAGKVSLDEVKQDLAWLEQVEREAAALGLRLGVPDDIGDFLSVSVNVRMALELPSGDWVEWQPRNDV
ncbi:MAG: hypothetical protein M5R40_24305 [Anaerolineae bacterium]|nr:hypothetical protein [Anaerolineae bacterium]